MNKTVSLTIDGKIVMASEGEKLLWTALDNGIYIPNLCGIRENPEPFAGCRLCFVEIQGRKQPVMACTEPVAEGMAVNTNGEEALRLAQTGFELIMATHPIDCAHCFISGNCELQRLAVYLKVRLNPKRFRKIGRNLPVDDSHPEFTYDPNKCIICNRCIWACRQQGTGTLGYAHRGFERVVAIFGDRPMVEAACTSPQCREYIDVCPAGAFIPKVIEAPAKRPKIVTSR